MDEERINAGRPKISELIDILASLKDRYGDIYVSGAYDGGWNDEVELMIFDGHLIIGTIS